MKRLISLGIISAASMAAPAVAPAALVSTPSGQAPGQASTSQASTSINLSLTVGVYCSVRHKAADLGAAPAGAIPLGTVQEYCNSPRGYELVVMYAPGSLRGAKVIAGEDQVVLDGSGEAILSRSPGPRIRQREVSAVPGQTGFDTTRFELQIVPS